jgi:pyridoxine 4-dehydrogenase
MNARPTAAAAGTIDVGGDLTANRLGFGAMRITGPGIWGDPPDRDRARAALRRAIELDVAFIDTADSYGPEVSERLIAETLFPYPEELIIATKGGLVRPGPGRWEPDGRPEHLRQACEGSLSRLRLDRIDLYQFHRPDPKVPVAESIGALAVLKDEGKIRHVGVSNFSEEQLREAERVTPVVSVQNRYNVADRSSESMVDLCEQEMLVFLPWGADPGGRCHPGGPQRRLAPWREPAPDRAGLAAGQITADPGDPRLRLPRARRAERRGREHRAEPGRDHRDHQGCVTGMLSADPHVSMIRPVTPCTPEGCEDCLCIGSEWVHLRLCLTCGHVGCCDSSPLRHARGHALTVGHPIVQSFEPGEDWRWCYVDESYV